MREDCLSALKTSLYLGENSLFNLLIYKKTGCCRWSYFGTFRSHIFAPRERCSANSITVPLFTVLPPPPIAIFTSFPSFSCIFSRFFLILHFFLFPFFLCSACYLYRGLYFATKTVPVSPPHIPKITFFSFSWHVIFRLLSSPFYLYSYLLCYYFALAIPIFSVSFPFLPFSFPFLPFLNFPTFFLPLNIFPQMTSDVIPIWRPLGYDQFYPRWTWAETPPGPGHEADGERAPTGRQQQPGEEGGTSEPQERTTHRPKPLLQSHRGELAGSLRAVRGAVRAEHPQEAQRADGRLRLRPVQEDQPRVQSHSGDECQTVSGPARRCRLGRPEGGFSR